MEKNIPENGAVKKLVKTVLVADDSIFFRTQLSDILTEAGHEVRFAKNGKEVVDELEKNSCDIDLLILDLQMPDMDGFTVLKWMKEKGASGKVPVLVTTGAYEPAHIVEEVKRLGAAGLLTKGNSAEQVRFRVDRILFPEKA